MKKLKSSVNQINQALLQLESKYRITESKMRIATVGIGALIMTEAANAQLASTICKVYNGIFSNELISALAFVVLSILLLVMLLGDGQKEKSALIKFAVVLAALFNLPTLLGYVGASPC